MKNVVLIGASGFVGTALLNELLKRGHRVTALVRNPDKISAQSDQAGSKPLQRERCGGERLQPRVDEPKYIRRYVAQLYGNSRGGKAIGGKAPFVRRGCRYLVLCSGRATA